MTGLPGIVLVLVMSIVSLMIGLPPPSEGDAEVEISAIEVGKASWVRASLGPRYLALPNTKRGTRVRICGEAACVVRTQTDVGPNQKVHPDRIADLSRRDFEKVTGLSTPEHGTAVVTVEYLGRGPKATLPPTDTE